MDILYEAQKVFEIEIESLIKIKDILDTEFKELVNMIYISQGKVIITGMGKAGHIGRKVAATLSSLGTASFFLHPAEGLHGDLGSITKEDIVIAFSKSGESDEVIGLIPSIRKIGANLVSVTCKENSSLSNNADLRIFLPIEKEASAHQLAPTTSATAMLVFGDALAVVLSKLKNFNTDDFAVFHPNGSLGKRLLLKVESLIANDDLNPIVSNKANLKETIVVMSSKGLGGVNVINDKGQLVGIVTDGDLRRVLEKANEIDLFKLNVSELMTKNPITINKNKKAVEALELMENRKKPIGVLPVVDDSNIAVGMIRIHDIIRAGVI